MRRLVIIGGDAAGMSAAAQARRLQPAGELDIVAFERGTRTSYAACGLPYLVAREVESPDDLVARSPEEHRRNGIDVRTGHEVVAIDTDARTVTVRSAVGDAVERYDDLLIATGGAPIRPPLPGMDAAGVFDLRTLDDAAAVEDRLAGARRAVVVGGGYIGLEVAEAFVARGLEVTLLEAADRPMLTLDPDMSARVADGVRAAGIDLRLSTPLRGFEHGEAGVTAALVDGGRIPTDIVVIGLGTRPNAGLAERAGVPLGSAGGIVVDRRMRTPVDGVWAAGDCVESFHRVSRASMVIALGTHANKQGRVAGTNLGGGDASFPGVIGTAITRFGPLEIARTGLSTAEAERAGFRVTATVATGATRAHYAPGSEPAHVKVIVETGTGRLLGGQIVGGTGSGKRIDTLAVAVWNEMTVDAFSQLDLAYAPPFAPVWDPVLLAAGKAALA